MKLTKDELASQIAKQTGQTKVSCVNVLDGLAKVVERNLKEGNEIILTGVGILKLKGRAARPFRNMQTGESEIIPAHKVVSLSVAKALKDSVK